MAALGEICNLTFKTTDLKDVVTCDWVIENIPPCKEFDGDYCFRSPMFGFQEANWCCEIYPNRRKYSDGHTVGFESVSLEREQFLFLRRSTFTISMSIYSGYKCFSTRKTEATFDEDITRDFHEVNASFPSALCSLRLALLVAQQKDLKIVFQVEVLNNNILDVSQDLMSNATVSRGPWRFFPESLSLNMKDIFLNHRYCDVTIKVGEKLFSAHKLILKARSPVFAAMFDHEMAENLTSELNITDADSDVFYDILLYIYCGEVQKMSSDNVIEYYKIADKYNLQELNKICCKFMKCNMSETNFYDSLLLGDMHNDMGLRQVVENFMINNAKKVLQNEKWKIFKSENPVLSLEFLEMIIWKSLLTNNS